MQRSSHRRRTTFPMRRWRGITAHGGDFTRQVLDALTSNPEVWGGTVFFLTFDENDGLFDHIPPPAVPSYNLDGTPAGKATLDVAGMYFRVFVESSGQFLFG